jgi:hypothetical protein
VVGLGVDVVVEVRCWFVREVVLVWPWVWLWSGMGEVEESIEVGQKSPKSKKNKSGRD